MISGHRGTRGLYVTVISRFARRSTFLVALAALLVASGPALLPGAVTNAQHESIVIIDALGDSGIAGDATLIDNGDGTTTVDILLSGTSSSHSVSIHTGDCDQWGDASYPLADLDADGGSVSHVDVSLDALLAQAPLAVVVQQSMDETGPAVACGEIVGDSDGADPLAESGGSGEERLFAATAVRNRAAKYLCARGGHPAGWIVQRVRTALPLVFRFHAGSARSARGDLRRSIRYW